MSLKEIAGLGLLAACLVLQNARAQSAGSQSPPANPVPATGALTPPGTSQSAAPAPEKKHAKHVYTDDDFGSAASDELPAAKHSREQHGGLLSCQRT